MEPINYLAQLPAPFDQTLEGVKIGMDFAAIEQQQKQRQLIAQEQANFFANPKPTMRDALRYASILPHEQAKALEPYMKNFSAELQHGVIKTNAQILSALQVDPVGGVKLLRRQAEASRNAGDPDDADLYDRLAAAAEDPSKGPNMAFKALTQITAMLPGAKEMFESADKALSSIRTGETDAAFRDVMQGANTVDDVFNRIPQLAQLGEKGVEHAEKLLTQQRLREQQQGMADAAKASRAQERVETLRAMQTLNALFTSPDEKGQSFVVNKEGDIQPNESVWSKYAYIPTAGGPDMAVSGAVPSAAPAAPIFDKAKAAALGLDEPTMSLIQAQIQLNPKEGAKLLSDIVKQNIRSKIEAQKPAALSNYAKMLIEAGYQQGTPEFIAKMRQHAEATTKGAATGGAVSVTVGEAQKTIGKEYGKFSMDAVETAQKSDDVASDVSMIVEGMRGMGGGPIAQFKAWAGQFMPAGSDWGRINSMSELANTIQAKLAPQMRAAGSGATSDMEMKSFMRAIPTLQTSERGRELMAKYSRRIADRSQIRAEIVNDIEGKGKLPTPAEISAKMKARIGDVFFDASDREYFGMKPTGAKPETVTVGGKTYSRPPYFTDGQWAAYKQSVGAK